MINKATFTSKPALHWFEEGKKQGALGKSEIQDERSSDEFEPEDELEDLVSDEASWEPEVFLNSDMIVFNEGMVMHADHEPWILYVESDEHIAFEKAVIPRTMFLARGRKVVGIEGDDIPDDLDPGKHLALVILDASLISEKRLQGILRCEESELLSKVLLNRELEVVFYMHRIHGAKDNLAQLMAPFVDCRFGAGDDEFDRSPTTNVILSGLYNQPNTARVVHRGVTSRCAVCGVGLRYMFPHSDTVVVTALESLRSRTVEAASCRLPESSKRQDAASTFR